MTLAMWSGPRNISTAMMRAWENRSDSTVIDEPFYAHYLSHTGIAHPMASEIIAAGESDWQRVVERISRRPARGIVYQKHITVHMLPHIALDFLDRLAHVFLIRDPRDVLASYAKKRTTVTADDLGYDRQQHLFDTVTALHGRVPPVIDSARFLQNPRGQLEALCQVVGIAFDPAMLHWSAGERDSDGIWHRHWYDAVKRSTGFEAATGMDQRTMDVATAEDEAVIAACLHAYDALSVHALRT